jgi:chromosome segregation ATPase
MADIHGFVPELDPEKARHLLAYLTRAHQRVTERMTARERLEAQLRAIRRFGPAKLREQLDELEASISSALEKERKLLAGHKKEDFLHAQLRGQLNKLESRVDTVIGDEEERRRRIFEIEQKIRGTVGIKVSKLQRLREHISRLERMHAQLKDAGADEDRLQRLEIKLHQLKERLEELSTPSA